MAVTYSDPGNPLYMARWLGAFGVTGKTVAFYDENDDEQTGTADHVDFTDPDDLLMSIEFSTMVPLASLARIYL